MSTIEPTDLKAYCLEVAQAAQLAAGELALVSGAQKDDWLKLSARLLRERSGHVLAGNARDLEAAPGFGLSDAAIDRLRLTTSRIEQIAAALEEIAMLRDPVGEIIESSVRPNGLEVSKVRVPLGVVFFIYESRPNVTADAAGSGPLSAGASPEASIPAATSCSSMRVGAGLPGSGLGTGSLSPWSISNSRTGTAGSLRAPVP